MRHCSLSFTNLLFHSSQEWINRTRDWLGEWNEWIATFRGKLVFVCNQRGWDLFSNRSQETLLSLPSNCVILRCYPYITWSQPTDDKFEHDSRLLTHTVDSHGYTTVYIPALLILPHPHSNGCGSIPGNQRMRGVARFSHETQHGRKGCWIARCPWESRVTLRPQWD